MNKNGLLLKSITSKVNYFNITDNSFAELQKSIADVFTESGSIIVYLDYKVMIGKFENSQILFYQNEIFDPKFIKKVRLFNKRKELHIWKQNNSLKARFRDDESGESVNVIEAKQIMLGTDMHPLKDGFTSITEERGTEIILPFENLDIDAKKKRLSILTRNYIEYNQNGLATYNDVRFVQFCKYNSANIWEDL